MSLISKYLWGIDLEAEQSRGQQLDADLAELNRRKLESGQYSQQEYEQAEAHRLAGATGNVAGEVQSEFYAGAREGATNVLNFPGQVVGTVSQGAGQLLGGVLAAVPWWAWVGGLAALFVWMGGLTLLRGRLR